jgi:hypothetical protein
MSPHFSWREVILHEDITNTYMIEPLGSIGPWPWPPKPSRFLENCQGISRQHCLIENLGFSLDIHSFWQQYICIYIYICRYRCIYIYLYIHTCTNEWWLSMIFMDVNVFWLVIKPSCDVSRIHISIFLDVRTRLIIFGFSEVWSSHTSLRGCRGNERQSRDLELVAAWEPPSPATLRQGLGKPSWGLWTTGFLQVGVVAPVSGSGVHVEWQWHCFPMAGDGHRKWSKLSL